MGVDYRAVAVCGVWFYKSDLTVTETVKAFPHDHPKTWKVDPETGQALWRETSGRIFNVLVRLVSGLPYHDTQCGFKAYRREAARRIARLQRVERWAFDVEHLRLANLLGLSVRETPVRWINSPATRVRFITAAPRMLLDIIRIRLTRYDV